MTHHPATTLEQPTRRTLLLGLGSAALLSAGCMSKPMRQANADGTYCYRIGKSYRPSLTCTAGVIPPVEVDTEARQFTGASDRLTVYVVRKRWGDTKHALELTTPGAAPLQTVPETFARWRLQPGPHALTLAWSEGEATLDIDGRTGEVLFVEVIGTVWAWGSNYRLELADAVESRMRAQRLRLVADVS